MTNKQVFYESKSVLLCAFLIVAVGIGLIMTILFSCVFQFWMAVLTYLPVLFILGKRYLSARDPYIIIDDLKLEHDGQVFLWPEIREITLASKRFVKGVNLFLKIDQDGDVSWVDLKYFSDKDRRALLDAVEAHKTVQYKSCTYESNIQTWFLGSTIFIVIFLIVSLCLYSSVSGLAQ